MTLQIMCGLWSYFCYSYADCLDRAFILPPFITGCASMPDPDRERHECRVTLVRRRVRLGCGGVYNYTVGTRLVPRVVAVPLRSTAEASIATAERRTQQLTDFDRVAIWPGAMHWNCAECDWLLIYRTLLICIWPTMSLPQQSALNTL